MSKDFFDDNLPAESVNFGELMIYDNQFVVPVETDVKQAKIDIADNTSRITTLEQQIPGGGTGTGAFLNLGGVPDAYPTVTECDTGKDADTTGFLLVAKPDGIYFYNPSTKTFIPPKKGGGNMAIHANFPDVFDDSHVIRHSGRITRSGVFLAAYDDIGITAWTDPDKACQLMVSVHEGGGEQQIVMGKEGLAYKLIKPGDTDDVWVHYQGTPGGGGGGGGTPTPGVTDFTGLDDTPDNYAGMGGKFLAIKITEDGVEFVDPPAGGGGPTPTPGKETFLELLDTPNDYTGRKDMMVIVNPNENGLTFAARDPDVVATLYNALKEGQPVINSRSVSSGHLVSDQNVLPTQLDDVTFINMTGTSGRTTTLPKVVAPDTPILANGETRAGRLFYIHNQTDVTKRYKGITGDVFIVDGAEITTSQLLGGKSSAIVYPTWDGTRGVWYTLSKNTIDAPNLLGTAHPFITLADVPQSYTGGAGKVPAVKGTEDGLEFVDLPTVPTDIMTEPEVEAKIAQILGGGLNLVNGNGLGGGFAQTSGDVSNTAVAGGSILVGSGSSTGKKFTMPMIVAKDVTTLSNSEVRAGRITYIINMGTQPRTIEKVSGVRFYINGAHTDTVQTIKAGVCMVFMPGIWGDGTKSWMPIGQFNVAEASGVTSNDLYTGQVKIANRSILYVAYDYNGDIAADKMANNPFIIATGAAGNRILTLPTIMPKLTDTLTSTQVREGYRLTVYNQAAGPRTLRLQSGQFFWKDWATNTLDYAIPSKHMEDFLACKVSNNYVWIPMHRRHINNDQARFVQTDKDFLDGLSSGNKMVHAKSITRPTTMITGASFSADQAASGQNIFCNATAGNITGTAPTIASVSQATLASGEVRLGTEFNVFNHSTSGTVTINFPTGSQKYARGAYSASHVLQPGKFARFVALHVTGSTYGWALANSGDTGV